jgi:CheY-like chemotaxis protein
VEEEARFEAVKSDSISLLVGGIAHDFNNMLTATLGNIALARLGLEQPGKVSEKLVAAENSALQAKSLSQQLLNFSKENTPAVQQTSIPEVIEESAQFILRGSNVKFELSKPNDLWIAEAEKGQISQVVNNLIINADQAMPKGGTIYITLRNLTVRKAEVPDLPSGDFVCIEVKDSGVGIPRENLTKIFTPYFTTKKDGNGLGLASANSMVKSHGGTITADSSPGYGSIFRVYLPKSLEPPLSTESENVIEPEKTSNGEVIHSGRGRVLLMDDMEAMMMVAGEILDMLGYEVEYSADGEEAIKAYKTAKESGNPFDAVVFDLTVPGGMGGEEAANILKEYDPDLKAIASSGYSTSGVMSDYKNSSFKAVVPKPYRINEMSDALRSLIGDR